MPDETRAYPSALSKILLPLVVAGIMGGIYTWADGRITATELQTHKQSAERKMDELGRDLALGQNQLRQEMAEMRKEIKDDLKDLSQAVQRSNRNRSN